MVVGEIATGTDVVVIGAGPGGYVAAIRAAQLGKDVTLVDKDALGGVCLNYGCIPSKALITASDKAHEIESLSEWGIEVDEVTLNPAKLQEWKTQVVDQLTGGVEQLCRRNGINVVKGKATLVGRDQVSVENEHGAENFKFEDCIIATGSSPVEIPPFPFDDERILDSRQALDLEEIPERLVVIGGGYIGLELGITMRKLGSDVTVVELMDQLLPRTDPSLVRVLSRRLRELDVDIHLEAQAQGYSENEDGSVTVEVDAGDDTLELPTDKVLVTVGRRPNSSGFGAARVGVDTDDDGFIEVDDQMRTSVPHIYAIGDVAGEPMLAHKASQEGIVAAEVVAGRPSAADYIAIPAVIFVDPEIAYVGLSEAEAEERGIETVTGRFPFAASGRAITTGDTQGFVKIVAEKESQVVLGMQIVGPEASDLISEAVLAIEMAATLEDIALTIHPHPTLPEAIKEAAEAALGTPVHTAR